MYVCYYDVCMCVRPDIWFSVRVLKNVRVMEIPLLRNWVHSMVMDVFTTCK